MFAQRYCCFVDLRHRMQVDGPLNCSLGTVLMVQQTSHECRRCRCCTVLTTFLNVCHSFSTTRSSRVRFVSTRVRRPYVLRAKATWESVLAERPELGKWNIWAMLLPRAKRKKKRLKAIFSSQCTSLSIPIRNALYFCLHHSCRCCSAA